jgi:hypothetical protein
MITIPPFQGRFALLMTLKAAMKTGILKQQKVLSMLLHIEPSSDQDPSKEILHLM